MLYLISAPPRTGKTLKVIEIIFKYLNEGRFVYTNIIGMNIPGVFTFSSGIQDPHDWRDLPNGSVVIYDEAHEHPAFAERNLIQDKKRMADVRDIALSLTLHGHFGFDIYMLTQSPHLLCREVLASVGTHYILRRKFGFDMAIIFEYAEARTTFSKATAKEALNKTYWRYPKHLYNYYISSEQHNIKNTFPIKYIAFMLIPLALFYKGYMNTQQTGFFGLFGEDKQEQQQAPQPTTTTTLDQEQVKEQIKYLCQQPENKGHAECRDFIAVGDKTPVPVVPQVQQGGGVQEQEQQLQYQPQQGQTVKYDINKPYDFDTTSVHYDIVEKPVLVGCMQYESRCTCYTQQATPINLSKKDCQRYLSGDKPFNYFSSSSTTYNSSFGETK